MLLLLLLPLLLLLGLGPQDMVLLPVANHNIIITNNNNINTIWDNNG